MVSFDSNTTGVTIGAGTTSPIVDACVDHYSNTTGVTSGVGPVSYISSIILNHCSFAYDFVDYCMYICSFSISHYIVCPSSAYGF